MPCIFCLAVFAMLAGAVTTTVLDQLEARLTEAAGGGSVRRSVDSSSVAKFELTVPAPPEVAQRLGRAAPTAVPVAVTVFKAHARVRLQVLTHDLTRAEAERVEDQVAHSAGLQIVSRSDAHDEDLVREALGAPAAAAPAAPQGFIRTEPQPRR